MRDLDESASGGLTQAFAHIPGGPDPRKGWGLSPPYFLLSNSGIIVFAIHVPKEVSPASSQRMEATFCY